MKLKVNGMHCDACKSLIKMELEENGFDDVKVDGDTHEIQIPENLSGDIEEIKSVINSMESYDISE
ncbi:cation transporter [Candidatus Dojkabacteria bacterium]|uniref:Cation transporter n=1 Tax=Candidatus Dojkabacteria bacterium TaxID=2099670 RepID=A0A955L7C8_9BACT|nr:cation transporter [Candidatus Dojkabacteria bacterium]